MGTYKFSPIKSKEEFMKAIEYVHFACFELTKRAFGKYLPISGNLGIFSHFDDEFAFLTKIREELTQNDINWNQKYFLLHEPIVIPKKGDVPETTYTFLYVRRPDVEKPQVGDIDLVLGSDEFEALKSQSLNGKEVNGVKLSFRPDLNMVELYADGADAVPFITFKYMNENVDIPNK
jgi:hypothetical protein